MSQENVEIVKNAYRGLDERGVDGLLEFIHEDVEYLPVEESGAVRDTTGCAATWRGGSTLGTSGG